MVFDLNQILDQFNLFLNFVIYAPPFRVYYFLFTHGGWFIFLWIFLDFFLIFAYLSRFIVFSISKIKWIYLAIDVPKGNEQTPKAVEQIFAHLAGAHKNPDLEEAYLDGYHQPWFSFEIVSIEGYTQFIIGTIEKYRDLVEAAIYAQYSDAEITEIEDYAKDFPDHFPNKENYMLFGTEFVLTNEEYSYPIRTYSEFEHPTAENVYKDPLAALLETLSRLGKGEFAGIQITIKPISNEWHNWKKHGLEIVQKMIGAAPKKIESNLIGKLGAVAGSIFDTSVTAVTGVEANWGEPEIKKDAPPSLMLHLPPRYKAAIERVEGKLAKICFACKIRFVYLAKKEVYNKNRAAYGVTGAMKQFNTEDLNGLKPDFHSIGTHVHYFMKEERLNWRRNRLINAYKSRSRWFGISEYLLNIEELASLWHFPMLDIKPPLLATTEAKRGQPPSSLPTERGGGMIKAIERKALPITPPSNLPI